LIGTTMVAEARGEHAENPNRKQSRVFLPRLLAGVRDLVIGLVGNQAHPCGWLTPSLCHAAPVPSRRTTRLTATSNCVPRIIGQGEFRGKDGLVPGLADHLVRQRVENRGREPVSKLELRPLAKKIENCPPSGPIQKRSSPPNGFMCGTSLPVAISSRLIQPKLGPAIAARCARHDAALPGRRHGHFGQAFSSLNTMRSVCSSEMRRRHQNWRPKRSEWEMRR